MAQYMKKEQKRSFPANLDEKPKKEYVEHKEDITLMSGREEECKRVEVDANELEELDAKEKESTSPELNEMREGAIE